MMHDSANVLQFRGTVVRSVLVALCVLCPAAGVAQQQTPEQTVREFLIPFADRDVIRFIPYFADDATMFFPPANSAPLGLVRGRSDIERAFKALYAAYPRPANAKANSIVPQDLQVQESGDHAVVTFVLGTNAAPGRRTLVLRRIGKDWKILHLHGSSAASP